MDDQTRPLAGGPPRCPSCGGSELRYRWVIRHESADHPLARAYGSDVRLLACVSCRLTFKSPAPTSPVLRRYYAALAQEGWWQHPSPPPAWIALARALEGCKGGRVLDVGCFRGDLAQWLGPQWQHYGVEPSAEASRVAQSRGVTVLGDTLESLGASDTAFDAVLLCDVIEHLPDPYDALAAAWRHVKPGGKLLVVTGTPDALSWRLARGRYWYTVFPEHLVFCGAGWFRWAARRLGARCRVIARVPTVAASPWLRFKEAVRCVQYLSSRRRRRSPTDWIVWWTTAADHLLVCLEGDTVRGSA